MPLSIPNLDDKTFDQIVYEARSQIPRYASSWTDHNLHDPGITFLELFAWLTEMQIFSLDQVTEKHLRKFLKLVNHYPLPATPAKAQITFSVSPDANGVVAKKGTQVAAIDKLTGEDIIFETDRDLYIGDMVIKEILTCAHSKFTRNTDANDHDGLFYFPFGERPTSGDALYLGFEYNRIFPTDEIRFSINLFESDLPLKIDSNDGNLSRYPSAELIWEYWSQDQRWKKLEIMADNTAAFEKSGEISFLGPKDIKTRKMNTFEPELYWIRALLLNAGYEIPPRIDSILLNTVTATQGQTWSKDLLFVLGSGNGRPDQSFSIGYLPDDNLTRIFEVREVDGKWCSWSRVDNFTRSTYVDNHFVIDESRKIIVFGNGIRGRIPPRGQDNIRARLLSEHPSVYLGSSDGLPNQVFILDHIPVLAGTQLIEVLELDNMWRQWSEVFDFDASTAQDRHYMVNHAKGEIIFGDGIHGQIPPAGDNNIRVRSYRSGGGEIGNVPANAILKIISTDPQGVRVTNKTPATGGSEDEALEETIFRAKKDLRGVSRAVTSEDYQVLALATPDLRIKRAKALPGFHPKFPYYKIPGVVSVVVVPYVLPLSEVQTPVPSSNFIRTVYNHLKKYRLLTTNLFVIKPEYVKVVVKATVKIKPKNDADRVKEEIVQALQAFLHPLAGGPDGDGWPFGRDVMRSEVYQVIENISGVDYVELLSLQIVDGCAQLLCDNIVIPDNALVYSDRHEISIIS